MVVLVPIKSASAVVQGKRSGENDREQLIVRAGALFEQAKQSAANGAVAEAGLFILKALDCERRVKAQGPQVLGVIRRRV